ncbi:hypothetical protein P9112_007605 [Eukaryota sp. TZLM1-RC]
MKELILDDLDTIGSELQQSSQGYKWTPPPERKPIPFHSISLEETHKQASTGPGVFSPNFDLDSYTKERNSTPSFKFIPGPFSLNLPGITPLDKLTPNQQCSGFEQLSKVYDRSQLLYLNLSNTRLSQRDFDLLFSTIQADFTGLQYLLLANSNLRSIEKLSSRSIRVLDLETNPLSKVDVPKFTNNCPLIENLNLVDTGIKSSIVNQMIGCFRYLRVLNNSCVQPKDRGTWINKFGPDEYKNNLGLLLWDLVVMNQSVIQSMTSWLPFHIREIQAKNCELSCVFLDEFKALERLYLSGNRLTSLENTGLAYLDRLTTVDLSNNQLSNQNDFKILSLIPSLSDLSISNNNYPTNYRQFIIYSCRFSKGTNNQPGINYLDGQVVTIGELVDSCIAFGMSETIANEYRWTLVCISTIGHRELYSSDVTDKVKSIKSGRFSNAGLGSVDLKLFSSLELLDLSNNNLEFVDFTGLNKVKFLNISGNPINLDRILPELDKLSSLCHLNITSRNANLSSHDLNSFRIQLIARLLTPCPHLSVIDDVEVSILERVNALVLIKQKNPDLELSINQYFFNSTLTLLFAKDPINWLPKEIIPGNAYSLELVKEINLEGRLKFDFDRSVVNFGMFLNLEALNIADCGFESLSSFGIEKLSNLAVLDCRHNHFPSHEMDNCSQLIDNLPNIQIVYFHPCPMINNSHDRSLFLSLIASLQSPDSQLKTVDSPITMKERLEIWRSGGLSDSKCHSLMFKAAINFMYPTLTNSNLSMVNELKLVSLELVAVDLSRFVGLRRLILAKNNISSLKDSFIGKCSELQLLDLRNNSFSILTSLLSHLVPLTKLTVLGLAGNPMCRNNSYEINLIGNFELCRQVPRSLIAIDDVIIDHDYVCKCWKRCGGSVTDVEVYRFRSVLFSLLPEDFNPADVTSLDLSGKSLSLVNFSDFPNLKQLNLSNNNLFNESIQYSAINSLKSLEFLNLCNNELKDLNQLAKLVDELPTLVQLGIGSNPCTNSSSYYESLLKKLNCIKRVDCNLRFIDSREISPLDVVKFSNISNKAADSFKIDLVAHRQGVLSGNNTIKLNHCGLSSIKSLSKYSHLISIDLSHNDLTEFSQNLNEISSFPSLVHLNLCDNKFKDLPLLIDALSYCANLKYLYLLKSTVDKSTDEIETYFELVCSKLRGLHSLENIPNVFGLNPYQLNAFNFLLEFGNFSPNRLYNIDLKPFGSSFSEQHFVAILRCLAYLPVENLSIDVPAFKKISNIRFMAIFLIPSLKILNSTEITLEERSNAHSICEKMVRSSGLDFLQRPSEELLNPVVCKVSQTDQISSDTLELREEKGKKKPAAGPGAIGSTKMESGQSRVVSKQVNTAMPVKSSTSAQPMSQNPSENQGNNGNDHHQDGNNSHRGNGGQNQSENEGNNGNDHHQDGNNSHRGNGGQNQSENEGNNGNDHHQDGNNSHRGNGGQNQSENEGNNGNDHHQDGNNSHRGNGGQNPSENEGNQSDDDQSNSIDDDNHEDQNSEEVNVDVNFERFSGLISVAYTNALKTPFFMTLGSFLTKLEIITGFFQILGLLFAFNINIEWPQFIIWYEYLTIPFSISFDWLRLDFDYFDYIKYGTFIMLPLIFTVLYFYDFNYNKWKLRYVLYWKRHKRLTLNIYFVGILLFILSSVLLVDFGSISLIISGNWPSGDSMGFLVATFVLWSVVFLLYFKLAKSFRSNQKNSAYWFNFIKTKRRICLFSLTILFMPVSRTILSTFICKEIDGELVIATLPAQKCGETFQDFTTFQLINAVMGALFMFSIPIFFFFLIRKGVALIDRNYNLKAKRKELLDRIDQLKRDTPPGFQDEIKRLKKEIRKKYSSACQEFSTAQSYLFAAYRRPLRYWKVIHMIEKGSLLFLSVFMVINLGELSFLISSIIVGLVFVLSWVTKPLSDGYEVFMDVFSRFSITVTAISGFTLMKMPNFSSLIEPFLVAVHLINAFIMLIIVAIGPIRSFLSIRKLRLAWEMARQSGTDGSSFNTQTAVNTGFSAAGVALKERPNTQEDESEEEEIIVS